MQVLLSPAQSLLGPESQQRHLGKLFVRVGAVRFFEAPEEFASGLSSPMKIFYDKVFGAKDVRRQVLQFLSGRMSNLVRHYFGVPPRDVVLAGVAMGGVPWAAALASECGMDYCHVRRIPDGFVDYSTFTIEGADVKGRLVLPLEDIVTTGGTSARTIQRIRMAGGEVRGLLSLGSYDFSEAQQMFARLEVDHACLVPFGSLILAMCNSEEFLPHQLDTIELWHSDPEHWGGRYLSAS